MRNPCLGTTSPNPNFTDSLSNPASPKFRGCELSGVGVLKNQCPAAPSPKRRRSSSFQSTIFNELVAVPRSRAAWGSVPGPGHCLLSFGPCWTPIPRATGRGAGRKGQTDGLRQAAAKLLPRAGGGRPSSSSSGRLWAPRSWLRILARLPHQLWGRSSCLNPVPQERHLLVIGTMEMAAGFWTWLRAASFRGGEKGEQSDSVWDRRMVRSATSVSPFSGLQPHPPGQEPAKSKVQPIPLGEGRSQGIGGKEWVRRGPGGQVSPFCFPTVGENPILLCSMCPWAWGPRLGLGVLQALSGGPPNPGPKIAHHRAPRCSRGTIGTPAGAGAPQPGPPWRRWGRACTSPRRGWSSPAPPVAHGPHP